MNETSERAKRPETCRMFDNELLERFSRIHPATPFVVWIPVVLLVLYRSWSRHDLEVGGIAGVFAAGFVLWTLAEYFLHRWVFHWTNDTAWGKRIHFLLHGVHHEYPTDKDRLVMPLLNSVPVGWGIFGLMYLALGVVHAEPTFAGFAIGYLSYDGIHFWLHRYNQKSRIGKWMKHHHMRHHYMDHSGGFGVSNPLWDFVFRTMPKPKKPVALAKKEAA